ncbi:MAG: hypothetical protein OXC19_04230 [Bryobacterales bacterium]|nr:hypothetical protein [Bryobacterales bacterium]
MRECSEPIILKTSTQIFVLALLVFAGSTFAIELTCGACREDCRAKHAKHWNEKRPYKFYDLSAECETAECGACCNGELVKTPSPNGKYFVAWWYEDPLNPGQRVRPLPPSWSTSGRRPSDIRLGDVYKDGNLVERVVWKPNTGRGYFDLERRDCENNPYLHPCQVEVCKQSQKRLRVCESLADRIECDSKNLQEAIKGGRYCRETGQTYFVPVDPGRYGQGYIEVPETPIYTYKGKPEEN